MTDIYKLRQWSKNKRNVIIDKDGTVHKLYYGGLEGKEPFKRAVVLTAEDLEDLLLFHLSQSDIEKLIKDLELK